MPKSDGDIRSALAVAFRHYEASSTTEKERDAILSAMVNHLSGPEGEAASRALHHRHEAREQQLTLTLLLSKPSQPTQP